MFQDGSVELAPILTLGAERSPARITPLGTTRDQIGNDRTGYNTELKDDILRPLLKLSRAMVHQLRDGHQKRL